MWKPLGWKPPAPAKPSILDPDDEALDPQARHLMWCFLMHPGPIIASRGLSRHGPVVVRELNRDQILAIFELLESSGFGRMLKVMSRRTMVFAKELPQDLQQLKGEVLMENLTIEQYKEAFWDNPKYVNNLGSALRCLLRKTVEEELGTRYMLTVSATMDWADPVMQDGDADEYLNASENPDAANDAEADESADADTGPAHLSEGAVYFNNNDSEMQDLK